MMRTTTLALGVSAIVAVVAPAHAAASLGYQIVERVAGPDGPWDYVRIDPTHERLLMPRGSAVMAVDLANHKVTTGLAPGGGQHIALPLNGGREFVVTNGATDTADFIDAATGAEIARVQTGKGPDAAAVDPKSGLVLVIGHAGGDVTLIEPKAHKAVGTVAVGGALEEAAADGSGRAFVNVESRNEIAIIDVAARKVTGHWPLKDCDGPTGLAYDPQDKLLLAACDGTTDLVRVSDGQVVQSLPTGKGADGVAYDQRRHLAFVPAGRDGTLSVIAFDKGHARIAQTVPTQRGARTLAEDERSGRVYLPTARYAPAASPGGRPTPVPGTFQVLVVAPR